MKTGVKVLVTFTILLFFAVVIGLTVYLLGELSIISGDYVSVVPVKGEVTLGGCSSSLLGGSVSCASVPVIKEQLEAADGDDSVKAIVLDVNSGGGGVVASREFMRAVQDTEKPVVAYIGEVGASGAYYGASAADYIISDRNSLTGSIGVIMTLQHYYGLFEKIGVNVTVIKSGNSKDIGSPYRPVTDEEREELQEMLDEIYYDFVTDIASNRNLSLDHVENISTGEVFLGSRALEYGLVDGLGGLDDAVDVAARLGGIEGDPELKEARQEKTLRDLLNEMSSSLGYGLGRSLFN